MEVNGERRRGTASYHVVRVDVDMWHAKEKRVDVITREATL
jgi:hypothetical protein